MKNLGLPYIIVIVTVVIVNVVDICEESKWRYIKHLGLLVYIYIIPTYLIDVGLISFLLKAFVSGSWGTERVTDRLRILQLRVSQFFGQDRCWFPWNSQRMLLLQLTLGTGYGEKRRRPYLIIEKWRMEGRGRRLWEGIKWAAVDENKPMEDSLAKNEGFERDEWRWSGGYT